MDAAIAELQRAYLDDDQIESSRAIMGIDTQLIDDGTYFVVEVDGASPGAAAGAAERPSTAGTRRPDATARGSIRRSILRGSGAMYTAPAFARRGVGRLILSLCERAAAAEGFTRLELMSTLSGEPLYAAYGFRPVERLEDATGGAPVPLVRMEKLVAVEFLPPR